MLSIRLGSFFAYLGPSPSLSPQPSPDERDKRSSAFLRCLSHLKTPQTSYKSSSGSWLHLDTCQYPFPSREPRGMLSIRLGSFSVQTQPSPLSVTAPTPRRVLTAPVGGWSTSPPFLPVPATAPRRAR